MIPILLLLTACGDEDMDASTGGTLTPAEVIVPCTGEATLDVGLSPYTVEGCVADDTVEACKPTHEAHVARRDGPLLYVECNEDNGKAWQYLAVRYIEQR